MVTSSEKATGKQQRGQPEHRGQREGELTPSRRGDLARAGGMESFHRLREEFDQMLNNFFTGLAAPWNGGRGGWGLDIDEKDDQIVVHADAPGFEPGDFDLQVRGHQLILRASQEGKADKEEGASEWRRRELYKSVTLPADVDSERVEAAYRNGVLTITLPKTERSKAKQIPVRS
jgi:HSP20 family protein